MSDSFKRCPFCGKLVFYNAEICQHCGKNLVGEKIIPQNEDVMVNAQEIPPTYKQPLQQNTIIDKNKDLQVPVSVSEKFNWGAFFLDFAWLLWYRQPKALILWSCQWLFAIIPFLGLLLYFPYVLGLRIWFGINGNKWAWQTQHYSSEEEFHNVHRKIAKWATIICGIIPAVLVIIGILFALLAPTVIMNTIMTKKTPWNSKMPNSSSYNTDTKYNANFNDYEMDASFAISDLNNAIEFADKQIDSYNSEGLTHFFEKSGMGFHKIYGSSQDNNANSLEKMFRVYTFTGDGSCTSNGCYVTVDLDGPEKGSNQEWTKKDDPKDIIVIPIKATNEGKKIQIIKPEFLPD